MAVDAYHPYLRAYMLSRGVYDAGNKRWKKIETGSRVD